jgi:ribosomal protein S17
MCLPASPSAQIKREYKVRCKKNHKKYNKRGAQRRKNNANTNNVYARLNDKIYIEAENIV